MKKWNLQIRLTVIVGVILLAACLLLTTNSLFAARTYYGNYAEQICIRDRSYIVYVITLILSITLK